MAKRLVTKFGEKTLDIIEHEPEKLLSVDGIGQKRVEMIRQTWETQKDVREVMVFLQGHGVSSGYSAKIFQQYGQKAIEVVRENPYQLTADVFGIGFITADSIAEKVGVPRDSLVRAEAGILYVLEKLSENGHVFGHLGDVLDQAEALLAVDQTLVSRALENLRVAKKIVVEDLDTGNGTAVYLKGFYAVEKGLANRLRALLSVPLDPSSISGKGVEETVQKQLAIVLSPGQLDALDTVFSSKISIVTGGPGTGKTTLVRAILAVFEKAGKRILMAAPTGRAAKRLAEVTGRKAKTIHRLLAYNFNLGGFQKNEQNPLDCDVVIIDEASMVDVFLMYHLVKALPATAMLVLVGDINQLPPVGPGNVLRDMIDSKCLPAVYLTEIFRQARDSLIVMNAHRINEGDFPSLPSPRREQLQDFYFIEQEDPDKVLATIEELCCIRIPDRFGLDPMKEIQVLTPMHKGVVGTANLNKVLQNALNPHQEGLERMGRMFKTGDKVMQIQNNYMKEVFNGDIGTIRRINKTDQILTVDFDAFPVEYGFSELDELVLAYAVSVHKSQGSEYGAVVIPVLTQHFVLLQRNLIYTGVTRAKKLVVLVGTKRALAIALKNDRPQKRLTRLAFRLQQGL
jgi:exodeoxyribonuclease V alpha subunit